MKPTSLLPTPEELGLNLEEDSPDLTEAEVGTAISTETEVDFAKQVAAFVQTNRSTCALRRKSGILYCRVSMEGASRLFQMDWLKKRTP